jgi:D-alanyl-lipoteichoic acid acyltransferase DltB (MBOAT superfamily)
MAFAPVYLLILSGTIFIAYLCGLYLGSDTFKNKKFLLSLGIVLVCFILAFFKYYNSLNEFVVNLIFSGTKQPLPYISILLPVGLSFHTFQVISYMTEVYRCNFKPEKNFGIFSLYVLFFPKVISGPIERPQNLLPQFRKHYIFDFENFKIGAMLMAFGFFKKAVIADRLAMVVDGSYNSISDQTGSSLLIATLFYSLQIYCDFSGYTDIAIGSARIMGFKLSENFNSPYFSKSITEFWTRWHISLSTWLRDYLFLPLAYKTVRLVKNKIFRIKPEVWSYIIATLITMFICGIWHGDTWAFVIWGSLHGIYLTSSFIKGRIYKKYKIKISKNYPAVFLRTSVTFLLVTFAWIFFRAADVSIAFLLIKKIFSVSVFASPSFVLNPAEMIF